VIVGGQLVAFAFYSKVFAISEGLLPQDPKLGRVFRWFTLEKGICSGLLILLFGVGLLLNGFLIWGRARMDSSITPTTCAA